MFNTCGRWAFLNILYLLCRGGYYPPDFLQLFFLLFLVFYRCSFVRQKNEKRRELKYLPDPEPLGACPKTPCKRMFFRIAQFIASQCGEGYLYSECNAFGIYRSDAYAAATHLFTFYNFRQDQKNESKKACQDMI